jgi:hypothetical protein
MSELQNALNLFGLMSLEDVTAETLKKAFKTNILKAHPDKGGDAKLFDDMLHSYVYLSETVQRVSGGRATLQNIVSPDELKGMRADEIVNRLFEEFEREEFNKTFETENKLLINTDGYYTWLRNKDGEDNLMEGEFGSATQKPPTIDEKDFNKVFEQKAKEGKPEPTALILHPEAMAYVSGQNIGVDIIESNEGGYTSQLFTNPKYTDAYEAFSNLTVFDKLPTYTETNKTLDDLIAERNKEITPFNDTELQSIQEYEKKKIEKNTQHYSKVKEHFQYDDKYQTNLANWPPEKYDNTAYKGFRMDF